MIKKPISNILSSNIQNDDLKLCLSLLFNDTEKQSGKILEYYEKSSQNGGFWPKNAFFDEVFSFKYIFPINAGRSALLAILECLELPKSSEIMIQAFTCTAAINPIIKAGFKPIYADIDSELNIDPNDIEKKITDNTKAIIVQHTFGNPAQIQKIKELCKNKNIFLIEDCAHCLGIKYQEKYLGQFGDLAFFSFGRDKMLSAGFGGMIATNNDTIAQRLNNYISNLDYPDNSWTFKQLLHPLLISKIIVPVYEFFSLGKFLGKIFLFLGITSKSVYDSEKQGKWPNIFPKKMPGALKVLTLNQLNKLELFLKHRQKISSYYLQNIPKEISPVFKNTGSFIRFPILINDSEKKKQIIHTMAKNGIYLYDGWSDAVILPPDAKQERFFYKADSCPNAQNLSKQIINLPTHINIDEKDAQRIISILKQCK